MPSGLSCSLFVHPTEKEHFGNFCFGAFWQLLLWILVVLKTLQQHQTVKTTPVQMEMSPNLC